MLKSSAANDQSVQRTTCAICGISDVFVIVNTVVRAVWPGEVKSTSKYGNSSVAAGNTPMSQESSLFVVAGLLDGNVRLGVFARGVAANAFVVMTHSRTRHSG